MATKVRIVMKSLVHDLKFNMHNMSDPEIAMQTKMQLGALMELIDKYVPNDSWITDEKLQKIYEPYIIEQA